jgi:proteasome accessory factor C
MTLPAGEERLRRLLLIVPVVLQNQGIEVDVLAAKVGLSRTALLEALKALLMVGRPPFQPDDFIDVSVENDKVYVDIGLKFSAPPALTEAEAVALLAAAQMMCSAHTPQLQEAVKALMKALPKDLRQAVPARLGQLSIDDARPPCLAKVSEAVLAQVELAFDYRTGAQMQARRIQPQTLFAYQGQWYVRGWCVDAKAVRHFRIDKMANAQLTNATFELQTEARSDWAFSKAQSSATVEFDAKLSAWVLERWPEATDVGQGRRRVQIPVGNVQWLVRWILSFGGAAVVIEPEYLRVHIRDAVAGLSHCS